MSQGTLFPAERTLASARAEVEARRAEGIICPLCTQLVKEYPRKLNSAMARALVTFYRRDRREPGAWVYYRDVREEDPTVEYGLLRFWEFTEAATAMKRRKGQWRITDAGRAFVEDRATAPRTVTIFDNEAIKFSEERTSIRRALGDRFCLEELLRAA